MSGKKHDPNDELIGQGIGNMLVPFFGGIPATAAIARTAANVRAGGSSPLASIVHALFILAAILLLAPLLSWIPMAAMAALLLMVAWNMSEAGHFFRIVRIAPRSDVATLLTCFVLTVLFDMEIAVAVGMGLAAVLFIRRSIELTGGRLLERHAHPRAAELPDNVLIYDIDGPLFFGSAQKALSALTKYVFRTPTPFQTGRPVGRIKEQRDGSGNPAGWWNRCACSTLRQVVGYSEHLFSSSFLNTCSEPHSISDR
jgi:SulP family sulfate permease